MLAYTGSLNPTSLLTQEQVDSFAAVLSNIFGFMIDFLYTLLVYVIEFFTSVSVLWSLSVILIVFMVLSYIRSRKFKF